MEDPSFYDDEVIPGSDEEENSLIPQISCQNDRTSLENRIPPAITQDTIQTPFDATMLKRSPISSVSDGTTAPSSATKPRPKPRPLKKRTDMSSGDPSRQEKIATLSGVPMDADFNMSFDIAERAKMRSRNNKAQTQQPNLPASDIIELSSDDDDDFSIPPPKRRKATDKTKTKSAKKSKPNSELVVDTADPKTRPRPRLLKKPNKGANTEQTSPISTITPDNPIPTSSISNDTYSTKLVPSQLPPSDPPSSTAGSYDHPPITTLLQTPSDHDPSSPSSLFYSGRNKRKHAMSHIDELDSDPDPLAGDTIDTDTRLMPPPSLPGLPPTFFAGSSPVDDDRPPATSATSGTKTPAVKKSRKKKLVDNDDEDDNVRGTSKPKVKAKQKKIPAKKVEVVVERPKTKGKDKESKGKEKEVFKSREFIDDGDDDDDVPSDKVSATAPTASTNPESLTSSSFVPEHDTDSPAKAESSKKRKSLDREDDEPDAIGRTAGSSEYKWRVVDKSKRVIDSDNEDMSAHSNEATKSPKAKANAKSQDKPSPAKKAFKSSPHADVEINDATGSKQQVGHEKVPQNDASSFKENVRPPSTLDIPRTPQASVGTEVSRFPSLSSRYTIAPKMKSTPMSDLIRRVNSKPGSPFRSPAPRSGGTSSATPSTAYSPYAKASRTTLSRIAPLHPNRRTPPPPPPPPPPRKKTKKELEREEQWEEELIESVGGITEWACMSDAERTQMRRAKRDREMYGWED